MTISNMYALTEITMFAGDFMKLQYLIYNDSNESVDLGSADCYVDITYWGDKSQNIVIHKIGTFSILYPNMFIVTFNNSDTQDLFGKFVQSPYIVDGNNKTFYLERGIINIIPKI